MPRKKRITPADTEEILGFCTAVMRADPGLFPDQPPTVGERIRGCELLGKLLHLFDDKEQRRPDSGAAIAVREAMAAMKDRNADPGA